jgi:hypothetical protein
LQLISIGDQRRGVTIADEYLGKRFFGFSIILILQVSDDFEQYLESSASQTNISKGTLSTMLHKLHTFC